MAKLSTLRPRIATLNTSRVQAAGSEAARGGSTKRGYGYRWQQERVRWLERHPLCIHCEAEGHIEPATDVDHITPHRGDQSLFWDRGNWQSLCKRHHSAKTGRGE